MAKKRKPEGDEPQTPKRPARATRRKDHGGGEVTQAVVDGDADRLAALIHQGAKVDEMCEDGTPLIVAVQNRRLDLVRILVEAGAEVGIDFDPGNPLLTAVGRGDPELVRYLAPKSPESKRSEALLLAVQEGRTDLVGLLLEAGAGVDADLGQGTPLMLAAERGDRALFQMLAPHAESKDREAARRKFGNRARLKGPEGPAIRNLLTAARKGKIKAVQQSIRDGVDLEARDEDGWTPLHQAALGGNPKVIRALIEAGATVDSRDDFGSTPLMRTRDPEVVSLLVAAGADVQARDDLGQSALHRALEASLTEVVRALLASGADPNERFSSGLTPLDEAAGRVRVELLEALTDAGADHEVRGGPLNDTPLDRLRFDARMEVRAEVLLAWKKYLVASGKIDGRVDSLVAAASAGRIDEVLALIRAGTDLNAQGDLPRLYGATPLYAAAVSGHADVVRALIAANARLDEPSVFDHISRIRFGSPLAGAAKRGQVEVLKILIDAGADLNGARVHTMWDTPLMLAADAGQVETVRALIEAGTDVNIATVSDNRVFDGNTAYTRAKEEGHEEVIEVLLAAGAVAIDPNAKWRAPRGIPGNPFYP